MTFNELLIWMYPSAGVAGLGLLWVGAATIISFALNHQTVENKLLNLVKLALAFYGAGLWFAMLRIIHNEPNPFRAMAVMTAMLIYWEIGDWLAFGLYHATGRVDRRLFDKAIRKAAKAPPALVTPRTQVWKGTGLKVMRWTLIGVVCIAAIFAGAQSGALVRVPADQSQMSFIAGVEAQSLSPLANPGFEDIDGNLNRNGTRPVIFPEINVFDGWNPYYCADPYVSAGCKAPDAWKPYTPFMKRPEYKPGNPTYENPPKQYRNRVKAGVEAQQFFAASGIMRAGVYQVLHGLTPGATYEFSIYGQIWDSDGESACMKRDATNNCIDRDSTGYTSDVATADDRDAAHMQVGVDLTCGENAFAQGVTWSRDYGYPDGMYDHWQIMSVRFTATGSCATVYAGGYNKFAKGHNDLFLDEASLIEVNAPTAAAPTATPSALPTGNLPTVCPTAPVCAPVIVTATPGPTNMPAITPTKVLATSTAVITPSSPPILCAWYGKGAEPIKGWQYSFTDPQGSGYLSQNVRSGPGISYSKIGTINKGVTYSSYLEAGRLDCAQLRVLQMGLNPR